MDYSAKDSEGNYEKSMETESVTTTNHYYTTRRKEEEKTRNYENSKSCVHSTCIAITAAIGLSIARGLSFAFLRNGKGHRWPAFKSGTKTAFAIYTPIFLICTQLDCMNRMFSDHNLLDLEKRALEADDIDKYM